jgi:tetratricopeptide (TPR) repeat protein
MANQAKNRESAQKCIALNNEGRPCGYRKLRSGDSLCPSHLKMVLEGKEVKDHAGNPILREIAEQQKRRLQGQKFWWQWFGWFSTTLDTARVQVVVGILGIAAAIICSVASWPQVQDWILPEPKVTPVPTYTPTLVPPPIPTPTATPLAGPSASPGEFLILVARFHGNEGYNIQHRIIAAINTEIKELGISDVRVLPVSEAISPDQEYLVDKVGDVYNATAVIWGWMDKAGFTPNFTITSAPELFPKFRLEEVPILPEDTFQTYIREDLPAQMAYFTAWVVAQIYFWSGQIDEASKMLDRALEEAERGNTDYGLEHVYLYRGFIEWEFRQNPEQAIIEYSRGLNIKSSFGALYNDRGIAYADFGRYSEAVVDYGQAIDIYEQVGDTDDYGTIDTNFINYTYAYNNRCMAYTSLGDYDQALDDCNKAIELQMGTSDVTNPFVNRGYVYWRLDNFDAALDDFEAAIAHDPRNIGAYLYIGRLYERSNDLEQALSWYGRAIAIEPTSFQANRERSQAYSERGGIYEKQGDDQAALKDYGQAILVDPNNADAYGTRGRLYEQLGQNDEALADYIQVLLIDQDEYELVELCKRLERCEEVVGQLQGLIAQTDEPRPVHIALGILYKELEEFEKAIRELSIALDLRATPDVYLDRASVYLKADNAQAALVDYTEAIALSPWDADVYAARAGAYEKLDKLDEALEDRIQAVRIAPREIYAYDQLHELCKKMGVCERVLEDLAAELTAIPFNPDVYLVLAQLSKAMGEIDQAIDYYGDFLELDQDDIWVYEKRAELFEQVDRFDEAIADYSVILQYKPQAEDLYRARAGVYEQQEKYELALADYDKAIEIDPTDKWILAARASLYEKLGDVSAGTTDHVTIVSVIDYISEYDSRQLVDYCQKHATCDQAINELSALIEESSGQKASAYYARGRLYEQVNELANALLDYDNAIQLRDDEEELYLARARVHEQLGNYSEALADYDVIIKIDSWNVQKVYISRAAIHEKLGNKDQALEDYISAVLAGSYSIDTVENIVRLCDELSACPATLGRLKTTVEEDPTHKAAQIALGIMSSHSGDYESALAALNAAIELGASKEAYVARAEVYAKTGKYLQATNDCVLALSKEYNIDSSLANILIETCQTGNTCNEAINLLSGWNTTDASKYTVTKSFYYQSLIYAALGDAEEENQAYINLLSGYTTDTWYMYELVRRCRETNSCQMAIKQLNESIGSDTENTLLYDARGELHSEVGDYGAAVADFSTIIERDPTFSRIYELRAEAYKKLQLPKQAIEDYIEAMLHASDRFWLASNIVDLCKKFDLCEFAIEGLNAAVANSPESGQLYYARGKLYEGANQLTHALDDYDSAIALINDVKELFVARARLHERLGNYPEALADYDRFLEMGSGNTQGAYMSRAGINEKLDNQERALEDYISAVVAESNFTGAIDNVIRLCNELGSCTAALARFKETTKENPENRAAHTAVGILSSYLEDYETALTAFDAAVELGAGKEAYAGRAGVYAKRGQYLQATNDYVEALSGEPNNTPLMKALIETCQAGNTCQDAIRLFNGWITEGANEYTVTKSFYFQSLIYAATGDIPGENQAYVNLLSDYTVDPWYASGLLTRCKETGSCQVAINQLTTAIASNRGSKMLYYARGRLYFEQGDYEAAVADFGAVIELDPQFSSIYQLRAEAYGNLQLPREAIADYVQALQYTPSDWLTSKMIELCQNPALYESAMKSLDTALTASPRNGWLYYARGRLHIEQGDLSSAVNDFTQAIDTDASQETWLKARAEVYERLKRNSAALEDYLNRVMLDKSSSARGDLVQFCQEHKLCEDVVTQLSTAMEEQPNNLRLVLARAEVYLTWDTQAALEDYDRAVSLAPFEAEVYKLRAKAREKAEDFERALKDYVEAVSLSETDTGTARYMIELCQDLNNCQSVIVQLTDVMKTSGATASLLFTRGRVYEALEDDKNAIGDFTSAIEANNRNVSWDAYSRRAALYERQGNWDKAIEDYTTLIEDYGSISNYYERGLAYKELGNIELALQDLQAYLETNTSSYRRTEVEELITDLTQ